MVQLELRVLLLHHLRHRLPPQSAARKDVGLVDRMDREGRRSSEGDLAGDSGDALDFGPGVDHGVPGGSRGVGLLTLAKVDTSDELEQDTHIRRVSFDIQP
jgi:hypothetical protein